MKENEDYYYNNNNINKNYKLTEDEFINTNDQETHINLNYNFNKKEEILDMKKNKDLYTIFLGLNKEYNAHLYETNRISTSKYTYLNFMPKILI